MKRMIVLVAATALVALAACSGSSEPTATYTGDECDYDGPSNFDLNTNVTFTVTNESDHTDVGFGIWKFPSGVTSEEIFSEGIFQAVGPGDDFAAVSRSPTPIGEPEALGVFFDTPGQWGINCFVFADDRSPGQDHTTMFTVNE
jgi:hypothetical protein